ncbi:MAG: hypothetical protein WDN69_32425 [Aliidongia sp.]
MGRKGANRTIGDDRRREHRDVQQELDDRNLPEQIHRGAPKVEGVSFKQETSKARIG